MFLVWFGICSVRELKTGFLCPVLRFIPLEVAYGSDIAMPFTARDSISSKQTVQPNAKDCPLDPVPTKPVIQPITKDCWLDPESTDLIFQRTVNESPPVTVPAI